MTHKPVREIAPYAIAIALVSGSNFATALLLLQQLGPEGFAIWAKLEPVLLLCIPLAGLGLNMGIMPAYNARKTAMSELFPVHLICAVFTGLIAYLVLIITQMDMFLAGLAALIIFAEGSITFLVAYYRCSRKPIMFALFEGGRAALIVVVLATCLFVVVSFPSNAQGYLEIRVVIALAALILSYAYLRWPLQPNVEAAKEGIQYGLPIVLSSVCVVIIMNFDRYGLDQVSDDAGLATYVAHVKVVQILGSALSPFVFWFAPQVIRLVNSNEPDHDFLKNSFTVFFAVNLALALGLWLITPVLWSFIFPSAQFDQSLFAILLAGTVVFVCGSLLSSGAFVKGRTHKTLQITLIACFVGAFSIAGMVFLTPQLGATGVALGKMFAMWTYTLLLLRDTQKTVKINYDWAIVGLLLAFILVLGVLGSWLASEAQPSMRVLIAFSLPASYLGICFFLQNNLLIRP